MRRLRFGITPKLTFLFVLFAAGLLAGVGALAYANGRAALQAATVSELLATAIEKQAALSTWVEERQSDIAAQAASPALLAEAAALLAAPPDSAAARRAHDRLVAEMQTRAGAGRDFTSLLVMQPESGLVIAATNPDEEGKFKEDQLYFINGRSGPYVQNLYYSTALQGPAMTAAAPLLAPDGRLLGVLAGRMKLDEMNAIISRRTGLRQSDDAFLVNTSNLFVTQPRFVSDPAVLQRGVHTVAVNRCLARDSGVVSALDYRGEQALIVYRWLPERGLCLIVKVDQAEALAPARAFGGTVALVGGLTLLAASALAIGLARSITGPVRLLVKGAREIGQGHLDYRIEVKSKDELGQLALTFNQMAANLHQSRAQLEAANKELEAFTYSVSHDLRAPLRAITGFARILLEDFAPQLEADSARYLNLIATNTQQMGQLVDDLLAFSRLGRQPLNKETVQPEKIVRRVLAELQGGQENPALEMNIGELAACQGDPALLQQVWANLIANALKFSRIRLLPRIEIGSYAESADGADSKIIYYVRDNGVGFDMQYAHKLFGVFQRLHRADEFEGTGVGLAIVQRIIHRHGGRVWAEARPEAGATFYFTL